MNESDNASPDAPVNAPLSDPDNKRDELRKQLDLMRKQKRQERAGKARKKYRVSRLYRYRHDLLALRKCGASYGEMREWLKKYKKVTVATTTILRFLAPFLESSHEPDENK